MVLPLLPLLLLELTGPTTFGGCPGWPVLPEMPVALTGPPMYGAWGGRAELDPGLKPAKSWVILPALVARGFAAGFLLLYSSTVELPPTPGPLTTAGLLRPLAGLPRGG